MSSSISRVLEREFQDNIQQQLNTRSLVELPEEGTFTVNLFPHQLASVYNMEQLEKNRFVCYREDSNSETKMIDTKVGIFADKMGSGKSLSLIYLILRDKMEFMREDITFQRIQTDHTLYYNQYQIDTYNEPKINTTLIVASSSIIHQWIEYFSYVQPGKLKVLEISKTKDVEDYSTTTANWDVILLSTTRYHEFIQKVGRVIWKRVILDDIVSTPIKSMITVLSHFLWIVSATWEQLRLHRGYGMMSQFVNLSVMRKLVIKNSDDFIRESFNPPDTIYKQHQYRSHRILQVIGSYVSREVQEMISSGDYRQAINELGGGIINSSLNSSNNLVELVSRRHRNKLFEYNQHLELWSRRLRENPTSLGARNEVSNWTKKVEERKKIINELEEKYKEMMTDTCPICMDYSEQKTLLSCCQNITCCSCIMKWMETKKSCPLCRSALTHNQLSYLNTSDREHKEEDEKQEQKEELLSKEDTVIQIIERALDQNKKILIFSVYDFTTLRNLLVEKEIKFSEMSGTKATREKKIRDYKSGRIPIIFLNSHFSGAGINLTETDEMIFYSNVSEEVKQQNIGRGVRIGRTQPLVVHTLVENN